MKRFSALALMALIAGCSGQKDGAEQNALGITEVEVSRGSDELTIVARDGQRAELASLYLHYGEYVDLEHGDLPVFGRMMHVVVKGAEREHSNVGRGPVTLPLADAPEYAEFNAFLLDSRVREALAPEGVRFEVSAPLSEVPGDEAALATCTFAPSGSCGSVACFQFNTSPVEQNVCCQTAGAAINRKCTFANDPNNPCGVAGPGGCAVCWNHAATTYCDIHPTSGAIYSKGALSYCNGSNAACTNKWQCCNGGDGPWSPMSVDCIGGYCRIF